MALGAGLIGGERPSNRTDIAYLFYLPFSMMFVSSDKLHRQTAPLFMRSEQAFVWGQDLKAALKAVNEHFLKLPEEEREKGISAFAHAPPAGNLVADLWDKFLRKGYRDGTEGQDGPRERRRLIMPGCFPRRRSAGSFGGICTASAAKRAAKRCASPALNAAMCAWRVLSRCAKPTAACRARSASSPRLGSCAGRRAGRSACRLAGASTGQGQS